MRIDFGKLENIREKLSESEITALNDIFNNPEVIETLKEIEKHRKTRKKWQWGIWIFGVIIGFCMVYFLEVSIEVPIILVGIASAILYKIFSTKIEIPLKEKVLKQICPLLYSKLEYSHDGKYSFDEIGELQTKGLLNDYNNITIAEDSIFFPIQKDGKNFYVHGFELKTTKTKGSGKNRRTVTTNHDYLIKAEFPQARIPMNADLLIKIDDVRNFKNAWMTKGLNIILTIIMIGMFVFTAKNTSDFIFLLLIGFFVGIGIFLFWKERKEKAKLRVKLENIEFENLFDVYCEDQVVSRMIITPAFMDRLIQFVQKTGNQYEFLFRSNIMYVKRKIMGSYLEAGTQKDMTKNLDGYVKFYTDMREIIQFVYDMNLMYLSKTDVNFVGANYKIIHSPILGSTETSQGNTGETIKHVAIGAGGSLLGSLFGKFMHR